MRDRRATERGSDAGRRGQSGDSNDEVEDSTLNIDIRCFSDDKSYKCTVVFVIEVSILHASAKS